MTLPLVARSSVLTRPCPVSWSRPQRHSRLAAGRRLSVLASSSTLISDVSSFRSHLKLLLDKKPPLYVVFSADLLATTQLPWCPDCVRTLPAIQKEVSAAGGSLLEVRVGSRPEWKDPLHPFRLDPKLHLRGIPTLCHVNKDGTLGKRAGPELERAPGPDAAAKIVAAFIAETRNAE